IGAVLVVDRQITLGQFVASELIIVLVVGSVEKVIINLDVIYDILTGLKKVAKITDLQIESQSGLRVAFQEYEKGVHLRLKNMHFRYPGNHTDTLKGINMEAAPGESVCIVGPNDSGKHTLMKVITGTLNGYDGVITINHYSLRDVNLVAVRDIMSKSLSFDEIFDGTILDNITLGRTGVYHKDVLWAIQNIGLSDFIASLKDGLFTHIGPSGLKLSSGVQAKLLLARSVVSRPRLLVVDNFMEHISKQERLKILSFLQDKQNGWTVIFLSVVDDPPLMQACEKVFVMKEGQIVASGDYDTITQSEQFVLLSSQTLFHRLA
ncbi:MAG: ATP-binding cassette domain-containing protein, partial [Bacteroidota bacterium]